MQWGLNVHQQPAAAGQAVFRPETVPARTDCEVAARGDKRLLHAPSALSPSGGRQRGVVDNAYVQIVKAGIWIPYGEVYQYYLSRKARMMKHPLQG